MRELRCSMMKPGVRRTKGIASQWFNIEMLKDSASLGQAGEPRAFQHAVSGRESEQK